MNKHLKLLLMFIVTTPWSQALVADSTQARCDIYPRGEDTARAMIACTFSQRQGFITIAREDGVIHDLSPAGDNTDGNFTDERGRRVYRRSGLGDQGLVFRFPDESVYLYWNTAALEPGEDQNNITAPFSTADYDATTLLKCRALGDTENSSCPAGILRMDQGQASIVVQNLKGEQFTINFMKGYVNATNRAVEANLVDDTWMVTINGEEIYEVPLAAIEGG